jgi:TolB-like protein/Flp pilus assembly protein TadD
MASGYKPDDDPDSPAGSAQRPAGAGTGERLESWKAIAAYLGRDMTTVQRWERQEGLPVHRLLHAKSGSIYAFSEELDQWRRSRSRLHGAGPSEADHWDGPPPRPDDATAGAHPSPLQEVTPVAPPATAGPSTEPPARPAVGRRRLWRASAVLLLVGAVATVIGMTAYRWSSGPRRGAVGAVTRVAVLPLKNLIEEAGQQYFADGMTEAIIARLATVGSIQVTSRTSVMQFKESTANVAQIARALDVDALVEGSVARSGDRIRIIVKLIDAEHDTHLWTREFERDLRDVLALQGEVADAVASSVQVTASSAREQASRPVSAEAYQRYLKARFLLNENTRESIEKALLEFQSALGADQLFAPAYAGLGIAYQDLSAVVIGAPVGRDVQEQATAAARRAVELDPQLAEAHSALGRALMGQLRWTQAEAAFRRALQLNPSDSRTHLWMGEWFLAKRQSADAVASARRAQTLDPLSVRTSTAVAYILHQAGQRDDAIAQWRRVLAVHSDYLQAEVWLGSGLLVAGNLTESQTRLEHAVALSHRSPWVLASLAHAYARNGRPDDAQAILRELLARSDREWIQPTAIASGYAAVGKPDDAIAWLDRAITERARGVHLLATNWAFAGLADDPRFAALLRRIEAE